MESFENAHELDYWNGSVLNVAHGMTPVCMEFLHVLLQRPEVRFVSDHSALFGSTAMPSNFLVAKLLAILKRY
jgi:hypothetical protein